MQQQIIKIILGLSVVIIGNVLAQIKPLEMNPSILVGD